MPLVSLLNKSVKVLPHLGPGWQRSMLQANIGALQVALTLMKGECALADLPPGEWVTQDELPGHLAALRSMATRTAKALEGFEPGTSQHSLLANRLRALQLAEQVLASHLPDAGGIT